MLDSPNLDIYVNATLKPIENTRFPLYPASENIKPKNFSLKRQVTILFS
jgi:hypothetical protein